MYQLAVKLPYPVQDTKGTAKYDKASKSLTVTLPVKPPVTVSHAPAAAATPSKSASDSVVQELPGEAESASSPAKTAPSSAVKKSSVGHGRWVGAGNEAPSSAAVDVADEAPLSLHEQIKRQAEAALAQAKAEAAAAPKVAKAEAPAVVAAPAAPTATAAGTGSDEDFVPAQAFAGRKAGFVFKRGDQGVGYYRDQKQRVANKSAPASVAASSAAVAAPAASSTVYSRFPYECRQTKHALAMIVQVPSIDTNSVQVTFLPYAVHVAFRAFVDGDAPGKIESQQYGAVFTLSETQCAGGLDVSRCRYDAANHNMALVLTKQVPQYWSAGAAEGAAHTTTESKSGELDEDAMRLLKPTPYAQPPSSAKAAATPTTAAEASPKPVAPTKVAKPEEVRAVKALENAMQALQFSSADALFELD
jgi:HSP20 family molecular chaperone IbpA